MKNMRYAVNLYLQLAVVGLECELSNAEIYSRVAVLHQHSMEKNALKATKALHLGILMHLLSCVRHQAAYP